jgi:hypothetical protein
MADRSLLRQLEQIRRSATYDDAVTDVNTSDVAEPTVSGSLEADLNVLRTLVKGMKGTTNWYDDLGKYFDPTNTTSGTAETKDLKLSNLKNNTLDSKTVIVAVTDDNSGSGYTVSGTSAGVLVNVATAYATPTNITGLPIFASTANTGSYWDEGGNDRVVRVDIVNMATDTEVQDASGNTIYAKMIDGADNGGTGTGVDVYMAFYANGSTCDLATVSGGTPATVKFVYPVRKQMSAMNEWDWMRTNFISSWDGDVELMEDIQNLWAFIGSTDGTEDASWTNTTSSFVLASNPDNLRAAIDLINTAIGSRDFTNDNYLTDGQSLTASLDALNVQLKTAMNDIANISGDKYVESVAVTIVKNTEHTLPAGLTYTPISTAGQEGKNMDVYIDGQLLAADTGVAGVNADRDYGETTTSGITFRFNVQAGRNITYNIRK